MAKTFKCSDAGMQCGFESRGASEQDFLQQVAEHARGAHGMELVPPELVETVRGKMRDA